MEVDKNGRSLILAANGFFLIYVLSLISALWPPRPLDPRWQLELANVLVNQAFLPLGAVALGSIAASFSPADSQLQQRSDQIARAAVLAAVGFLLLVPLQLVASWQAVDGLSGLQARQQESGLRRLDSLRRSILAATTSADLNVRLQALQAPALPNSVRAAPLPVVKQQLLTSLASAEISLRRQIEADLGPGATWAVSQKSVQVILMAFIYGICFAGAARRRGSQVSLLQEWKRGLINCRYVIRSKLTGAQTRTSSRQKRLFSGRGGRRVDDDYLDQIYSNPHDQEETRK